MRTVWTLAAVVASFAVTGVAGAQQPMNPYGTVEVEAPAPPAPPAAPAPPTVLVPAPQAQPIDPYGHGYGFGFGGAVYPAPPAYGYQPPTPGRPTSSPPAYQQGYYLYSGPNSAPIYYAPPPSVYVRQQLGCNQLCGVRRPPAKWDGVRRFSLGVHATFLAPNMKVGSNDVVLGGAGFQLRLRSKGRFGFEASQSFLHAEYWNGGYVRNSYPFSLSLMLYIFPNQDTRHFNLYGLVGVGAMPDNVRIRFQPGDYRTQDFMEWEAHAGVGAELRFKWFAIDADARIVGLLLDKSDKPASYYDGVAGGPIPDHSRAAQGNLYVSLWF